MPDEQQPMIEPAPVAEPAAPKPNKAPFEPERIDPTLKYIARNPEALEYAMGQVPAIKERMGAIERELTTERALRKFGLNDSDVPFIEAATPEGIMAKAEALARRNQATAELLAAKEAEGQPAPKPEIQYPKPTITYANELEAAQAVLRQFG